MSLAQIWPPDGRWVPVRIDGVTDADGDALSYRIDLIGTDEPVTTGGRFDAAACPDAIIDEGGQVRCRPNGIRRAMGASIASPSPRWMAVRGRAAPSWRSVCRANRGARAPRASCGISQRRAWRPAPRTCVRSRRILLTGGALDLEFATAEGGDIELDLYDVRGRQVAQITRSRFAPGTHVVRWDGLSTSGKAIANGVYILRVRAGGEVLTSKIVIAR